MIYENLYIYSSHFFKKFYFYKLSIIRLILFFSSISLKEPVGFLSMF